ncbi:DUF4279 domain-containing protein [Crossiella sp. CA-258035]|uniref:DUF4279 domain-containing protein n=1 Tax=Crossiella sp. CA-258035 TaxID=2981138 RepID=UPI0024BCAF48|nr:DUF4279 domain-containing protein [Crossiella sp. CA-258035]WHT21176.1 DUF4279 domain-containing protein [Crossiella sp. CA-258035]
MAIARASASLRLFSTKAAAAAVTEALDLEPTTSAERGEPIGKSISTPREQSMWLLESEAEPEEPLSAHLEWLLAELDGKLGTLAGLAGDYEVDVWCTVEATNGQGQLTFAPELTARLAGLPCPFSVDLYLSDAEDDEEEGEF